MIAFGVFVEELHVVLLGGSVWTHWLVRFTELCLDGWAI